MSFEIQAKKINEDALIQLFHKENVFCPYCNDLIIPKVLSAFVNTEKNQEEWYVYTLLQCPHCHEVFSYHFQYHPEHRWVISFESLPPVKPKIYFSPKITTLSPRFVELFQEALTTADQNIERVAILSFQTSLEYLIKDFLLVSLSLQNHPQKIESLTFSEAVEKFQSLELAQLSVESQTIHPEDQVLTKVEKEFTSSWEVRHYIAVIINHIEQLESF